jgi:hypothetical protein
MAGLPKSVNTDTPIDSHFLSYVNNLSTGGNTTNITSSKDTIKQYVKTKNGIFNGAFGSVGHALTISSGELDLTANATGAVVVRRMIQVNPESSTSDTIDKIESNGLELPYQELTLIATTNNTITLAHASSVSGTQKNIYCPGDTSYVLAPNEAVKLIYDPVNTIWIVTGSVGSSASTTLSALTDTDITSVSSGQVLIYDGSNSWDNKSLSGDVTINSSGVTAIGANTIGLTELSASGTASSSTYLRGDNTWASVSSGSTSFSGFTADATLDMNNLNIEDVNVLKINSGSANSADSFTVYGSATQGIINLVDDNNSFIIAVDGTSRLSISDTLVTSSVPISATGIQDVGHVYLDGAGSNDLLIDGHAGGLNYKVASGDTHDYFVGTSNGMTGTTYGNVNGQGIGRVLSIQPNKLVVHETVEFVNAITTAPSSPNMSSPSGWFKVIINGTVAKVPVWV